MNFAMIQHSVRLCIFGSGTTDTIAIGSVFIPAMIKQGYAKGIAVAVTAASCTLGVVIPPPILMIVFDSVAGVSIAGLFLGSMIPGVLIGLDQICIVLILAIKHKYLKEARASLGESRRFPVTRKGYEEEIKVYL